MSSSSLGSDNSKMVAAGIDLGSFNARVATYDEALNHPVLVHNHDGHRTTKVILESNEAVTEESLKEFYENRLLRLATDAAHTKDIYCVTSIPNSAAGAAVGAAATTTTTTTTSSVSEEWLKVLQSFGGVITEAAATCLAYNLPDSSTTKSSQRILVIDGGASGLKATTMIATGGSDQSLLMMEDYKILNTVNGMTLIEPLAQSVAQQFEQKHRFPRGEVWQSKKARKKLQAACEAGLTTLQINNSSVTIHVDGLYEGMDCQVSISKPKWQHLSSKLVNQTKTFLKSFSEGDSAKAIDKVILSGNLHTWLKPMVKEIFGSKLVSDSSVDPSEAVALGCTKQAYLTLQQQKKNTDGVSSVPTTQVPTCPVSIGIKEQDNLVMIGQGAPLPATASHETNLLSPIQIWQLEPKEKHLATYTPENNPSSSSSSCTVQLQLSAEGKLRIWANGESIVVG